MIKLSVDEIDLPNIPVPKKYLCTLVEQSKASSFAKRSLNFRLETSNHVGLDNWTSLDICFVVVVAEW